MFRHIRVAVLSLLLLVLGIAALLDKINGTRWDASFVVALYPISADGSSVSQRYVASLQESDFEPLAVFFQKEASDYGVALDRPLRFTLAPTMKDLPPLPPTQNPSAPAIMAWSLHFRWWAWVAPQKPPGPTPRVRIFLLFYDPARSSTLDHSTGLAKGRIGIAHLFAVDDQAGPNLVVLAHELLHTLGATDKYDPETGLPRYPDGFAEPAAIPRYPQRFAELMAGRIPVSIQKATIPDSLNQVLVGPLTAMEIGWRKNR
jgi:hypothetical protein